MRKCLFFFFLVTGLAFVSSNTVTVKDFKPAWGKWKGTLTYLDYSSGKPFTMPANLVMRKDPTDKYRLILTIEYPEEPKANGNDTLVISEDGMEIDGARVILKEKMDGGGLQIITEKQGVDGNDNKPAIVHHIYTVSRHNFTSRKEVKFRDGQKFITRNELKMKR